MWRINQQDPKLAGNDVVGLQDSIFYWNQPNPRGNYSHVHEWRINACDFPLTRQWGETPFILICLVQEWIQYRMPPSLLCCCLLIDWLMTGCWSKIHVKVQVTLCKVCAVKKELFSIHQECVLGHSVPAIRMGFLANYKYYKNIYHIIGCVLEQVWFAGIYYTCILPV